MVDEADVFDYVIVGVGVVGLAVARVLAQSAVMRRGQGDFDNVGVMVILNSTVASVFIASAAIKIIVNSVDKDGALIPGYTGMLPKSTRRLRLQLIS